MLVLRYAGAEQHAHPGPAATRAEPGAPWASGATAPPWATRRDRSDGAALGDEG